MSFKHNECPAELVDLIRGMADNQLSVREKSNDLFAAAMKSPLRSGILYGDSLHDIFEAVQYPAGSNPEFPLDCIAPGEEDEFVAFSSAGLGRIPERSTDADRIFVPTHLIDNAINWDIRYARSASWSVISRYLQIFEAGFVKKKNDDGWRTLLAGAADRSICVYDADAPSGFLTKRLLSILKVVMMRGGGGNFSSTGRSALTDLFLSPEGVECVRNWNLADLDDVSRREIYKAADDSDTLTRIFGVKLHALVEFGDGQEYQNFYQNDIGASLVAGDKELVIGLDLQNRDSFIMPYVEEVSFHMDPTLHRRHEAGGYGSCELGFGLLDTRRVIAGSF